MPNYGNGWFSSVARYTQTFPGVANPTFPLVPPATSDARAHLSKVLDSSAPVWVTDGDRVFGRMISACWLREAVIFESYLNNLPPIPVLV